MFNVTFTPKDCTQREKKETIRLYLIFQENR